MTRSRARRRSPARRVDASPTLTPRQKEILRLVAQGSTNREIAAHLGISVRTVEVHRFNLMRRLRVRNVAELLRQALLLRRPPNSFQNARTLASATGLMMEPPRPPNPPFGLMTTDSRSGSTTSVFPTELMSERNSTPPRSRTPTIFS